MKVSWKSYIEKMKKVNLEETLIYHDSFPKYDSYRVCRGRNVPPFYSYETLTQIPSLAILIKRGPGPENDRFRQSSERCINSLLHIYSF